MPNGVRYCGFLLAVLLGSEAGAHICDNVWRQAHKLIIKPEVTGLVVKDKASFKIYVQSNMKQDISGELRLVGRSEAFDVQVEPLGGHRVKTGKQYEYDVTLTLKPIVTSGEYPLHFDAIVGNRTMRSYTMEAVLGQSGSARTAGEVRMEMEEEPARGDSAVPVGTMVVKVRRHPEIYYYWYLLPIAAIILILLYRRFKYFRNY